MSVYVDNARLSFGRMKMCHMIADSNEELVRMADKIGVARKWIQKEGTAQEHFDVALVMRTRAIALGAIEIDRRQLAEKIRERRAAVAASGDASRVLGGTA